MPSGDALTNSSCISPQICHSLCGVYSLCLYEGVFVSCCSSDLHLDTLYAYYIRAVEALLYPALLRNVGKYTEIDTPTTQSSLPIQLAIVSFKATVYAFSRTHVPSLSVLD